MKEIENVRSDKPVPQFGSSALAVKSYERFETLAPNTKSSDNLDLAAAGKLLSSAVIHTNERIDRLASALDVVV